jgi:trehalose 6-phosphate synthase/phosphatase
MAGAAKELTEALIVNPNHRDEIAAALKTALEMPPKEQSRRNRVMQNRLRRSDIAHWAMEFLRELVAVDVAETRRSRPLNRSARSALVRHFHRSERRLLLFDYDGTLAPFASYPHLSRPTEGLLELLRALAADPLNDIVLLSGREKATLDEWFGPLGVGLVAEHGAWLKEPGRSWELVKPLSAAWKTQLLPILKNYADRVPGAFVEEKEFSIVWHYRNAAPDRGAMAARELSDDLLAFTANVGVQVQQANKSVEVRNAGLNKGMAAERWVGKGGYDFVLAIGDDRTDEDTFAILPERAYSIRVGDTPTRARFFLPGTDAVLDLVSRMAQPTAPESANSQPPMGPPTYH